MDGLSGWFLQDVNEFTAGRLHAVGCPVDLCIQVTVTQECQHYQCRQPGGWSNEFDVHGIGDLADRRVADRGKLLQEQYKPNDRSYESKQWGYSGDNWDHAQVFSSL